MRIRLDRDCIVNVDVVDFPCYYFDEEKKCVVACLSLYGADYKKAFEITCDGCTLKDKCETPCTPEYDGYLNIPYDGINDKNCYDYGFAFIDKLMEKLLIDGYIDFTKYNFERE